MWALVAGLAGVVVGGVLQAVTGLLQDSRSMEAERRRWLRDQQVSVFSSYLHAVQRLLLGVYIADGNERESRYDAFIEAFAAVELFVPESEKVKFGELHDSMEGCIAANPRFNFETDSKEDEFIGKSNEMLALLRAVLKMP